MQTINLFNWSILYFFSTPALFHPSKLPGNVLLVATVALQLYCNIHIIYSKWQQYKAEKNNVVPIRILLNDSPIFVSNENPTLRLNTTAYNKILVDVKHIICFSIFATYIIVFGSLKKWIFLNPNLMSITNESKTLFYFFDFGKMLLLYFIFPVVFYFSHKELRTYWKNTFTLCRRNQE